MSKCPLCNSCAGQWPCVCHPKTAGNVQELPKNGKETAAGCPIAPECRHSRPDKPVVQSRNALSKISGPTDVLCRVGGVLDTGGTHNLSLGMFEILMTSWPAAIKSHRQSTLKSKTETETETENERMSQGNSY